MRFRVALCLCILSGCITNDPYQMPLEVEEEEPLPLTLELVGQTRFRLFWNYDPIEHEAWTQCNYYWMIAAKGEPAQTATLMGGRYITDRVRRDVVGTIIATKDTMRWDSASIRSIFFDRHFRKGDRRQSTGYGISGISGRYEVVTEFDYVIDKTGQRATTAPQTIACDWEY